MALTEAQAQLVKDGWELGVMPDLDKHAMVFFLGIFERAPSAKALFSFLRDVPPEEDLSTSPQLQKHATYALKTAGEAVATFADPVAFEATKKKLRVLGKIHAKYNVQEAHFPVVKDALMDTLRKGFRSLWNGDMEAAWSTAVDIVATEMIVGLNEGYAKLKV